MWILTHNHPSPTRPKRKIQLSNNFVFIARKILTMSQPIWSRIMKYKDVFPTLKNRNLQLLVTQLRLGKPKKNGSLELISKYSAAANLGITTAMLRDWMKAQTTIEATRWETRKNWAATTCQEPVLEERLVELFTEAGKAGRKITHRWFVCQGQQIYGHLYPGRVIKNVGKKTEYSGFRFSHGWFQRFRQRNRISVRSPTKISQTVGHIVVFVIFLLTSFNRPPKIAIQLFKHGCNTIGGILNL